MQLVGMLPEQGQKRHEHFAALMDVVDRCWGWEAAQPASNALEFPVQPYEASLLSQHVAGHYQGTAAFVRNENWGTWLSPASWQASPAAASAGLPCSLPRS